MKRILSILLVAVFCVSMLAGCGGNKTEELAQSLYSNLVDAYDLINRFGGDIYESWRMGIYEDDDMTLSSLASGLTLSKSELEAGITGYISGVLEEETTVSAERWIIMLRDEDGFFSYCTHFVCKAYELNGTEERIKDLMTQAKNDLQVLTKEYPNYQYIPDLRAMYTAASQYFDFCEEPDGSFNALKDTIKDFRNNFGNAKANLEFMFGE